MIVLQINTTYDFGSTGRIVKSLHDSMNSLNIENYVVYARNNTIETDNIIKIKNNLYLNILKARLFDNEGLNAKNETKRLIDVVDIIKPDIIHLHNIHGYYLNYELFFKYLVSKNMDIVWTLHDCWTYTGHCAYYSRVQCEKWQDHCKKCPIRKSYPKSFFFDNSYNNFEKKKSFFTYEKIRYIAVSKWLENQAQQSFLKKNTISVISNGIDVDFFQATNIVDEKLNVYSNKFIILGVASEWDRRKGLDDFIELSKVLESDYLIILIGLSNRQIKDLPKNIVGLKRLDDYKELPKYYSIANVFLNLSREETMGLTTLEALSCGTPVITYNQTAVPENVTNEVGIVVKAGEINSLKEAIISIRRKNIEKETCRTYAKEFSKEQMNQKYINLYTQILRLEK